MDKKKNPPFVTKKASTHLVKSREEPFQLICLKERRARPSPPDVPITHIRTHIYFHTYGPSTTEINLEFQKTRNPTKHLDPSQTSKCEALCSVGPQQAQPSPFCTSYMYMYLRRWAGPETNSPASVLLTRMMILGCSMHACMHECIEHAFFLLFCLRCVFSLCCGPKLRVSTQGMNGHS
jgi:hypothetical protein